jgi:hypothetical protein
MEAPVAMRESMTTTMPSPPDWRSVFLFSRAWRKKKEDEKVSAILRATTTTKNRNARETGFAFERFPKRQKKRTKTARAPSIGNFLFHFPSIPHFGREDEREKKRNSKTRFRETD